MGNTAFSTYRVEERSYISIVKREIHKIVSEAGFSSQKAGEIDIIVSELTSNLVKHAVNGGELIFRINETPAQSKFFEIFCIDQGEGTNEIQKMIADGYSSSNTLGHGLGAISRLSDFFQIYSMKNWGTVVYSVKYLSPETRYIRQPFSFQVKAIQESFPGEKVCGDGYYIKRMEDETRIFVGDGLGHGQHAHNAVTAAIEAFKECDESTPVGILRYIHQKVKKTRGLVGTVVILDHKEKLWKMSGVGNILTRVYQGLEYKSYMPHNGIIGMNIPNTMSDYEIPADKFQNIIMASDGIKNKWDLSRYTSILKYDPAILAAAIFKDHARRTDDMTVVTGKLIF